MNRVKLLRGKFQTARVDDLSLCGASRCFLEVLDTTGEIIVKRLGGFDFNRDHVPSRRKQQIDFAIVAVPEVVQIGDRPLVES